MPHKNTYVSIEPQIEAYGPYLRPQVTDYLNQIDLLNYVHSQRDPKSKTVDQIIVADEMDSLAAATKAIAKGSVVRAVDVVATDIEEGKPQEKTIEKLGKIILDRSADETYADETDIEKADEALRWVYGLFSKPENIKAFRKLFTKKPDSTKKLTAKQKRELLRPGEDGSNSRVVTRRATRKELAGSEPKTEPVTPAPVRTRALPDIMSEIRDPKLAARSKDRTMQRRFRNQIEKWLAEQIDERGSLNYKRAVYQIAESLGVDHEKATEVIDNTLLTSELLALGNQRAGRVIERRRAEPTISKRPEVKVKQDDSRLDLDDWVVVETLLSRLQSLDVSKGMSPKEIAAILEEAKVGYDKERLNSIIREVCAASDGDIVFEKRSKSAASARLYFKDSGTKAKHGSRGARYVESLFEKALFSD